MKLDSILLSWAGNTSIYGDCLTGHTFGPVGPHLFEMHASSFFMILTECWLFLVLEGYVLRIFLKVAFL